MSDQESAKSCKEAYKAALRCLQELGEVKTSGTYIRSLEDTKPCDHIYDLKPLRNHLYKKVDAIDVNILPRIYTYQDHDLTDRLRTNEMVARVKPWHQAKLRRAVWSARASQCVEEYEACKDAEMMQTRASKARQDRLDRLHPQAVQFFTEGVGSVLRQWTALELAVHHQWGGPQSSARADSLVKEILDLFLGPDDVYKDDVSLLLEDFLDSNFQTICEDGSPDELGQLFCDMWRQCAQGNHDLVSNVLGREFERHEMVSRSEGLDNGDAEDGSDDGETNEAELALQEAVASGLSAGSLPGEGLYTHEGSKMDMEEDEEQAEPEHVPDAEPMKDPEGWETVTRGKKTHKRK